MEEQAIKKDYVSWWVDKATEEFERFTEEERAAFSYISGILYYIELAEKGMLPEKWIKVIDFAKKLSAEYVGWVDKMGYVDKIRRYYEEDLSPKEIAESLGPTVESNKALIIEEADNRGLSGPLREYILSHFPQEEVMREFTHAGFDCLVQKTKSGSLYGRVVLPKEHPYYGKGTWALPDSLYHLGRFTYGTPSQGEDQWYVEIATSEIYARYEAKDPIDFWISKTKQLAEQLAIKKERPNPTKKSLRNTRC